MRKLILGLALVASAALSQSATSEQRAAVMAEQAGDASAALAAVARLEKSGAFEDRSLALQIQAQFLPSAEFLTLAEPTSDQLLLHQIWRALRIEAMARAGQVAKARDELMLMRKEGHRDKFFGNEPPQLRIAQHLAVARINYAMKNYRGAAQRFARAAAIQVEADAPIWHQPLDSAVGASLLKAGDARGAYDAFARALARRPDNVWVLWGRAQAQAALGDAEASAATLVQVDKLWKGDRARLTLDRL
jgi:tetratricopeptide (TPR) repeat protein